MTMTLGEFIRSERDKKDMSLRDLAEKVGCSAPFLYDIELGRRHPSDELFTKIARHIGVSREVLEKYDTRPPLKGVRSHIQSNPQYALAFRKMIDSGMSPKDMMEAAKKAERKAKDS